MVERYYRDIELEEFTLFDVLLLIETCQVGKRKGKEEQERKNRRMEV